MFLRTGLLLACVLAANASAADPVLLAWQFKQGDTFYVHNEMNIDQTMTIMGKDTNQKIEQSIVIRFTIKKVGEDKSVVLEQTIMSMKQKGDLADPRLSQKMKGVSFNVTIDKDNKLTKFEGYKDFLDKVSDGNPMVRQILASIMSEDTFKQGVQETFTCVPGKKVAVGDKWDQKMKVSLGPIGDLAASSNYTYEGKKEAAGRTLDSVAFSGDFKYSAPGDQPQGLPFKITKGKLKVENFKGDYLFDSAAGRLVQAKADMETTGKMTFSFDGREVEVGMVQKLKVNSRVSDKEPATDE